MNLVPSDVVIVSLSELEVKDLDTGVRWEFSLAYDIIAVASINDSNFGNWVTCLPAAMVNHSLNVYMAICCYCVRGLILLELNLEGKCMMSAVVHGYFANVSRRKGLHYRISFN